MRDRIQSTQHQISRVPLLPYETQWQNQTRLGSARIPPNKHRAFNARISLLPFVSTLLNLSPIPFIPFHLTARPLISLHITSCPSHTLPLPNPHPSNPSIYTSITTKTIPFPSPLVRNSHPSTHPSIHPSIRPFVS